MKVTRCLQREIRQSHDVGLDGNLDAPGKKSSVNCGC